MALGVTEAWLAKLSEKLAENGIAGLLKPYQMRRVGRAAIMLAREGLELERERKISEYRTRRQIELLKRRDEFDDQISASPVISVRVDASSSEAHLEPFIRPESFEDLAREGFLRDQLRKEVNIAQAVLHAEAELEDEVDPPQGNDIDDDWLFSWRDSAASTSDEQLQCLWGRILAGEMRSPGTFSLRTMSLLRLISKEDAELVAKIALYYSDPLNVIPMIPELVNGDELKWSDLLHGQELGLISGVGDNGLVISRPSARNDSYEATIVTHGAAVRVFSENPNKKLELRIVAVTRVGAELFKLCPERKGSSWAKLIASAIKNDRSFKVSINFNTELSSGRWRYTTNGFIDI